ncbi:MAG TPA: hypothetical protein PKA95_12295 [Thermomicrobiales bacterium]|nr:hypothetical protein [Thermomicrobiales bacterium]
MTEDVRMALEALLRKVELDGEVDVLREGVRVVQRCSYEGELVLIRRVTVIASERVDLESLFH